MRIQRYFSNSMAISKEEFFRKICTFEQRPHMLVKDDGEFDEKVVMNIEEFLPYRNEAIEIFIALGRYRATEETWAALHRFFENLVPYLYRPENVTSWQEWDFDNFKFVIHELFLYAITALIHNECFSGVTNLLRQHYYLPDNVRRGDKAMVPFSEFREHLRSLEHRNKRLNLRRLSLHADLLEQRSRSSGLSFQQLMQADFMLFIRDCLDCLRAERWQQWWPVTLVYANRQYGPFEVFARSQSSKYFENLKQIFDINKKDDLLPLAEAFREQKLRLPGWEFHSIEPFELMGFEKLSTLP